MNVPDPLGPALVHAWLSPRCGTGLPCRAVSLGDLEDTCCIDVKAKESTLDDLYSYCRSDTVGECTVP